MVEAGRKRPAFFVYGAFLTNHNIYTSFGLEYLHIDQGECCVQAIDFFCFIVCACRSCCFCCRQEAEAGGQAPGLVGT